MGCGVAFRCLARNHCLPPTRTRVHSLKDKAVAPEQIPRDSRLHHFATGTAFIGCRTVPTMEQLGPSPMPYAGLQPCTTTLTPKCPNLFRRGVSLTSSFEMNRLGRLRCVDAKATPMTCRHHCMCTMDLKRLVPQGRHVVKPPMLFERFARLSGTYDSRTGHGLVDETR